MERILKYGYLVVIHAALFLVLAKSNFIDNALNKLGFRESNLKTHYERMLYFHDKIDPHVLDHSVIYLGDSHIQGLSVTSIDARSINYGIGRDNTTGLLSRIDSYDSLKNARAIVVLIGANDLLKGIDLSETISNFEKILARLPRHITIYICSVLPIGKEHEIAEKYKTKAKNLNEHLIELASTHIDYKYLDLASTLQNKSGYMKTEFAEDDLIHLNSIGYKIVIRELSDAITWNQQ